MYLPAAMAASRDSEGTGQYVMQLLGPWLNPTFGDSVRLHKGAVDAVDTTCLSTCCGLALPRASLLGCRCGTTTVATSARRHCTACLPTLNLCRH